VLVYARRLSLQPCSLTQLPLTSILDDHCESPPEAYADLAPFLDLVATKLGKTRATLEVRLSLPMRL
jgi:hypothetical protein